MIFQAKEDRCGDCHGGSRFRGSQKAGHAVLLNDNDISAPTVTEWRKAASSLITNRSWLTLWPRTVLSFAPFFYLNLIN